jgi:type IV fimbrial biogenesis protein FimT
MTVTQIFTPKPRAFMVISQTHRGFTMIEVMVVVAILGVLATLAGPSFTPMIERWRVRQAVESLTSTIYYARSEAIKRGGQVAIQKLPNNTNGCTTASNNQDWDCGWFVCADLNGNGTCNSSDPVLQRYNAPANLQISRTGGGVSIKMNRWGLVDGAWLGFSLVPFDKSTTDQAARGLCMSSGGRIRVIPPEDIPCTN